MEKRNQFLSFVCLAALAHDQCRGTQDSQFIVAYARRIPTRQIPKDVFFAALDLVKSCEGHPIQPWMHLAKRVKS